MQVIYFSLLKALAASSKKGIYLLTDFYYTFWYRYVFSRQTFYELMGPETAAKDVLQSISEYMGPVFAQICQQYLLRQARRGNLPFVPRKIGKWWGTNPGIKAQDDVDILAISATGTEGLFCECKYRNRPMPMEEYEDLMTAAHLKASLMGFSEYMIIHEGRLLLGTWQGLYFLEYDGARTRTVYVKLMEERMD